MKWQLYIFMIEEKNLFVLLLIEEGQGLSLIRCTLQQHDFRSAKSWGVSKYYDIVIEIILDKTSKKKVTQSKRRVLRNVEC